MTQRDPSALALRVILDFERAHQDSNLGIDFITWGGDVKRFAIALFVLAIGVQSFAATKKVVLPQAFWDGAEKEFSFENEHIHGQWSERQTWSAWICDGSYNYRLLFDADLANMDLELTDEGYMIASAELNAIYAKASGGYKSKATLCIPTSGWLGVGIKWAKFKTQIHFGEDSDFKDVRLKIISTELGQLEMGKYVPQWFEDFFTGVANRTLTLVWNSRLGDWLSAKISKVVAKNLPERGR